MYQHTTRNHMTLAGICLCMFFLSVLTAKAQDTPPQADEVPQNLEQALERLQHVLGQPDPDQQQEWWIPLAHEHRIEPEGEQPAVLQILQGTRIISQPFRQPDAIAYDESSHWKRQVYDVAEDGTRTLTRTQVSHNVARYAIYQQSGQWFVSATILSNGTHAMIDRRLYQGVVRWHANGIELIGTQAVDRYYAPAGGYTLGVSHGSLRLEREGDVLRDAWNLQRYELARDPQGNLTHFPDFAKPVGEPFTTENRSQPRVTQNGSAD